MTETRDPHAAEGAQRETGNISPEDAVRLLRDEHFNQIAANVRRPFEDMLRGIALEPHVDHSRRPSEALHLLRASDRDLHAVSEPVRKPFQDHLKHHVLEQPWGGPLLGRNLLGRGVQRVSHYTLKPAALVGGTAAAVSALSGTIPINSIPGIAQASHAIALNTAGLTAPAWMPHWLGTAYATYAPELLTSLPAAAAIIGTGWGLGKLWEWYQKSQLYRHSRGGSAEIPRRGFVRRALFGMTVPVRAVLEPLRLGWWYLGKPAAQWLWLHKWKFAGGMTLAGLLAAGGWIAATPAAIAATGVAAGATSAAVKEGGGSGGGDRAHA